MCTTLRLLTLIVCVYIAAGKFLGLGSKKETPSPLAKTLSMSSSPTTESIDQQELNKLLGVSTSQQQQQQQQGQEQQEQAMSAPLVPLYNIREKKEGATVRLFRMAIYFFLWYFLTVTYNVTNKVVLNDLPLPFTVSTLQLWLGIPVFLPIWLFKRPKFEPVAWHQRYWKIAAMHGFGNLATVISLGAGAVSFTHVIKACEPVFAAFLSVCLLKTSTPFAVYLSLIPIVLGVAIASATEISFTWLGFASGMASNLFYQLRIVLAKAEMLNPSPISTAAAVAVSSSSSSSVTAAGTSNEGGGVQLVDLEKGSTNSTKGVNDANDHNDEDDENNNNNNRNASVVTALSPANMFRILTLIAACQQLPLAIMFEAHKIPSVIAELVAEGASFNILITNLLVSGITYYLYNEVAFWILGLVSPVTHAVGNTIKRVVIIFASIFILKTPISAKGILGSSMAVMGTLLYSLALQSKDKKKTAK